MEAFSDGVFAIAITLLVLDFAIHPPGSPLHQVLHIWPSFVAYLVSFLTIGAAWLGHAALTRLARTDSIFLRLNLLLLLVVTFLPFPTGLVGEALREPSSERVFVTLYGLTLLAIRLLGFALDEYADREHLYAPKSDDEEQRDRKQFLPVVGAYVVAILIGLAFPVLAVWVYLGIAVYFVVPFREVSHNSCSNAPSCAMRTRPTMRRSGVRHRERRAPVRPCVAPGGIRQAMIWAEGARPATPPPCEAWDGARAYPAARPRGPNMGHRHSQRQRAEAALGNRSYLALDAGSSGIGLPTAGRGWTAVGEFESRPGHSNEGDTRRQRYE